jgi:predicted nucleic acid-binding protein
MRGKCLPLFLLDLAILKLPFQFLRCWSWRTEQRALIRRKEKNMREQFIQELLTALPVHPVTAAIALHTGQIDGANQARGVRIPLADLLIGVTALELDYGVATRNVRHFHAIPGLSVIRF